MSQSPTPKASALKAYANMPYGSYRILFKWIAALFALLVISGCKQSFVQPGSTYNHTSFDNWLEQQAAPYLEEQIESHPRFKNQRVKIAKVVAGSPQDSSDQFSQQIRQRLEQTIIAGNQARLVLQPYEISEKSSVLNCNRQQHIDYLLGIEVAAISQVQHRVQLRVMDIADRSWVKGFELEWTGQLNRQQLQDLKTPIADEQYRGQRQLPFSTNQTDIIAKQLAHELSCQMLSHRDQSTRVYLPNKHKDPFIKQIYNQLPHYLAKYKEANPVAKKAQAELLLETKLERVDGLLHQLWLNTTTQQGDLIAGLNANAYIEIAPLAQRLNSPSPKDSGTTASPSIADKYPKEPQVEIVSVEPLGQGAVDRLDTNKIFSRLLMPVHPKLCRSSNPWRRGERSQAAAEDFVAKGCFALELQVPSRHQTYLIERKRDGSMVRLAPDSCQGLIRFSDGRNAKDTLRFPSKRSNRSNSLRAQGQTYFAIAIPSGKNSQQLRNHITRLPGQCASRGTMARHHVDSERWLNRLHKLTAKNPDVIWEARTVHTKNPTRRHLHQQDAEWVYHNRY